MANQQINAEQYDHQDYALAVFRFLGRSGKNYKHDYWKSQGTANANDCRMPVWATTVPLLKEGQWYLQLRKYAKARTAGKTSYTICDTVPLGDDLKVVSDLSDLTWKQMRRRVTLGMQPEEDQNFFLILSHFFNVELPSNYHELPLKAT